MSERNLKLGLVVTAVILLVINPQNWPISGLFIFLALMFGKIAHDERNRNKERAE